MYFSEIIRSMSDQKSLRIIHSKDASDIGKVAMLDPGIGVPVENTLYFGYAPRIDRHNPPEHCILTAVQSDEEAETLSSLIPDCAIIAEDELFPAINTALSLLGQFHRHDFYHELMERAKQSKSLAEMINLAAARLENSVILLDTDYKILTRSTLYEITDPLWAENIRQGYCSYRFITESENIDAVKNAPATSAAVVVTCYASPLRKLASKFFLNGKRAGFVVMLEKETPIGALHYKLLPAVSAAVRDAIIQYFPYLIQDEPTRAKYLRALLIGAKAEDINHLFGDLTFQPRLLALCVRSSRPSDSKGPGEDILDQLSEILPDVTGTRHADCLAAAVGMNSGTRLSGDDIKELRNLAVRESLHIGISGAFMDIGDFAASYRNAKNAIDQAALYQENPLVCLYDDVSFYELLGAADAKKPILEFRHPALRLLNDYDEQHQADLYATLEAYIGTGGSVRETAEKLFIHRNSLGYRLSRIKELTALDLEDNDTLFRLNVSFHIDRYLESKKNS